MFKKLFEFQKLFLNSAPPLDLKKSPKSLLIFGAGIFFATVLMGPLMMDTPIPLVAGSIWIVNWILNGDRRLFELVPVSRKFTVCNVYLAGVILTVIIALGLWFFGLALVGVIAGILFLVRPENFNQAPPDFVAPEQAISTLQGNLFVVLVLIILLFLGITIAFIKSKRLRYGAFTATAVLTLGLLTLLKNIAPVSPNTGQIELVEILSQLPQMNTLLIVLSIATVIIVSLCVHIGHRLYSSPPGNSRQEVLSGA